MTPHLKTRLGAVSLVVIAVAATVFLALLEDVLEGEIMWLDTAAYDLFVVRLRADWLTPVMEGFTILAMPTVLLVVLVAIAAFAPGRRPAVCAAANLAGVFVLNQAIKFIVQRPRPEGFRLVEQGGYSFPSGHAMVAMAFYGLLIWMIWHYDRDRIERWVCCAILGFVIIMTGVSRIYLGVHYASDVLAGLAMSLIWLALFTHLVAPRLLRESEAPACDDVGRPAA